MLEKIVQPLMLWYDKNRRVLPWRENSTPYNVWVSEIMLQQTRVEAVKPFFERFTRALPGVAQLAECPEERLLKLWEGLGYYNRVRNMQKAARLVREQYGGVLPADFEALKALPGIGSYTAGAIASIAYGIPVPAVDGNVLRVAARLREDGGDIAKQSVRRGVEREFLAVMPKRRPGDFNQALMELGATVCVPSGAPRCFECPLAELCRAHASGREQEYPVKSRARERRIERRTILLILDGTRVAVQKRPPRGLLAGLYEFPNLEGELSQEQALAQTAAYGLTPLRIRELPEAKHIFSHVEWRMRGYAVQVAAVEEERTGGLLMAEVEHAQENYPVPAAYAAYAAYTSLKLGQEKYETDKEPEQ